MKNQINSLFMGLAVLFFAASCDMQNNQITSPDGNAKVNVYLIDAPANYEEVWIEVLGVEILPKGGNEENGDSWINLAHESDDKKINLLSLVGGTEAHLGEIEVPAGEISQIRLLLGEDNYLIEDGERKNLTTPSAQQSGLKLKIDKPLNAGISYDLIIDFDASQSIVRAGNSGQYILKPVLRVVAEASATIEGTILPLEAGPVEVTAIMGEDTFGTFTDESGKFVLRGLKTGSYQLEIVPNESYVGVTLETVETEIGEVTLIDPVQLEEVEESDEPED